MLTIKWLEGGAKGGIDDIPDWAISTGRKAVLVHAGRMPGGASYLAKCTVEPTERGFDFDYDAFSDFNSRQDLFLGLMRIELDDGIPIRVKWRDKGQAFILFKVELIYEPGPLPALARQGTKNTEQLREQLCRIGQGKFRSKLQRRYNGCCALTRLSTDVLLRASHIKPWAQCEDDERLDVDNGLLLAAHVDALFDQYLISFEDDGTLIWHDTISAHDRAALAFPDRLHSPPTDSQKVFLDGHRKLLRANCRS